MQGALISIEPNGERYIKTREGLPTLGWLKQGIGGGYIEIVPGFTTIVHSGKLCRCVAFCDDDGKRKQFPINMQAMKLWDEALKRNGHPGLFKPGQPVLDTLNGNIAIVIGDNEFLDLL